MKRANVYVRNILAGVLTEDDMGYEFMYDSDYLKSDTMKAVSLTLCRYAPEKLLPIPSCRQLYDDSGV